MRFRDILRFVKNPTFYNGVKTRHMPFNEAIRGLDEIDNRENDIKVASRIYDAIYTGIKRTAKGRMMRIWAALGKDILAELHAEDYITGLEILEKLVKKYPGPYPEYKAWEVYPLPYHNDNMRRLRRLASRRASKGCKEASLVNKWFEQKNCIRLKI